MSFFGDFGEALRRLAYAKRDLVDAFQRVQTVDLTDEDRTVLDNRLAKIAQPLDELERIADGRDE